MGWLQCFPGLVCFAELEFREAPRVLCPGFQAELHGVAEHSYPLEGGSDGDTETDGAASPEHALSMWMRGIKSQHSSCLSSRANSALSLTDTDHDRKSDGDNGNDKMPPTVPIIYSKLAFSASLFFFFFSFCFLFPFFPFLPRSLYCM